MRRLANSVSARLPLGWGDALRQLVFFLVVYQGYQVVRGIADGRQEVAFANAERVVDLERSLGAFFEPGFQQALLDQSWLIDFANWMYINSHYLITGSFLIWLYLRRN